MEKFFIIFFISLVINELIFRIRLLPSFSGDLHQKFSSTKSVPLTGGIILLIFFTYFFFRNNELIYICFFSIFVLGILSDLKKIISANKRFLLQIIICVILSIIGELEITSTRIDIFDKIISNKFINVFFCYILYFNSDKWNKFYWWFKHTGFRILFYNYLFSSFS